MEAVADEIAQHAAAVVADGFPVAHAQLQGAALDMPMHRDMAQRADGAGIEHLLGALPGHDLMEIEIDHGRQAAESRLLQHGARAGQIAGHRLFGEHRLAEFERADGDLRLQARQRGDGDRLHVLVLDQRAPIAIGFGHARGAGQLGGAAGVAAGERHHLAARIGAERGQLDGASVIAADDA